MTKRPDQRERQRFRMKERLGANPDFIADWIVKAFGPQPQERIDAARDAYIAWDKARAPIHVYDDNDDPEKANNVVMLPIRAVGDSYYRRKYAVIAVNETSGVVTAYDVSIGPASDRGYGKKVGPLPNLAPMTPLELGSFIGTRTFRDNHYSYDMSSDNNIGEGWFIGHTQYQANEPAIEELLQQLRQAGFDVPGRVKHLNWDHPLRDQLRELENHVSYDVEIMRAWRGLIPFIRKLDRAALHLTRQSDFDDTHGGYGTHVYEWLIGRTETFDPNKKDRPPSRRASDEAIKYRREAGAKWPGLLDRMYYSDAITQAIDAGQPQVPALAENLTYGEKLSPEFVRWMKGKARNDLSNKGKFYYSWHDLHYAFWMAAGVPPEWRPQTAAQWEAFDSNGRQVDRMADWMEKPRIDMGRDFVAIFSPNNTYFPDRILQKGTDIADSMEENKEGEWVSKVHDFMRAASAQIILPALCARAEATGRKLPVKPPEFGPAPDRTYNEWINCEPGSSYYPAMQMANAMYKDLGLPKLINLADRWHKRVNRIQTRTNHLDGEITWPALFTTPREAPNGVTATVLNSTADLVYMGALMDNCVGGYTHKCVFGNSHIIALEAPDAAGQALIEIIDKTDEGGKVTFEMVQIEAPGNQQAQPWARDAAAWLMGELNKNAFKLSYKGLARRREELRRSIGLSEMTLKVGFDPQQQDLAQNAYHGWHHEMRDLFPQDTLAEYLAASGIQKMIDDYMPMQPAGMQ
jgi:hypothetical protein